MWRGMAVILGLAVTLGACGSLATETSTGGGGSSACETSDPLLGQGARAVMIPPTATLTRGQSTVFTVAAGQGGVQVQDLRANWSVDGGDAFGKITSASPDRKSVV